MLAITSLMSWAGSHCRDRQRLAVIPGDALVSEGAEPQLARLLEDGVALFEFDHGAAGLEGQDVAVGLRRHFEQAGAHGPILPVQLDHGAAGIAGQVGGEVVGRRTPHRPVHEVGARVVRIGIVVEEVAHRKAADNDGHAIDVAFAGKLVRAVGDIFLFAAETEGLLEEVALRADSRKRRARLLRLAVRKAGDAERAVDPEALRQFRIEIQFAAFPQLDAEKGGRGPCRLQLPAGRNAIGPDIGRVDRPIALRQERRLRVDIPDVRFRQQRLRRRHSRACRQSDSSGRSWRDEFAG